MKSTQPVILAVAMIVVVSCTPTGRPVNDTTTTRRASGEVDVGDCASLPTAEDLRRLLKMAPDSGDAGGLFHGRAEWAAVVNRRGEVCALVPPGDSAGGFWPGSRSISMAKAFTANGFSTDTLPLSTARLYTLSQPGHSLWGVIQPEPFHPDCLDPTNRPKVCGGAITFGGGVPLYRQGRIVGGLGVSGDTPCSDHEIAKRIRHMASLDPKGGPAADDIQFTKTDGASAFTHPLCPNTWRNGKKIGDEAPATGY